MKQKTIYALGFFDGVHLGHQALLHACRSLADNHGCNAGAVTFTSHPGALVSGNAPGLINTSEDKKRLLLSFGMDTVMELCFDDTLKNTHWSAFLGQLESSGAAGFVCGSDFRFGAGGSGTAEKLAAYCEQRGLPHAVVPQQLLNGIRVSSTHIRNLLEAGDLEQAARFLGHPHILTGRVVAGRQLGRTIGVPTANLILPEDVVKLPHGVYACKAVAEGKDYPAVTNIGTRPTVGGEHVTVETFLLDFDGDLYGKELTVAFYRFLRPEQKFDSLENLQKEIQKNIRQARNFFKNCE